MNIRMSALTLALLVLAQFGAHGQDKGCRQERASGYAMNWCLDPGDAASRQVVYYFHGLGHTEADWWSTDVRGAILQAPTGTRPHVFSISFGKGWVFTDIPLFGKSRLQVFLEDFLPRLESMLPARPSSRVLVGESMGGLNALRLAMAAPRKFAKVIALCPAITPVGPHSTRADVDAFVERNPYVNVGQLRASQWLMWAEYPTIAAWTANSPLSQTEQTLISLPPIFLTEDFKDDYGFPEGIKIFADRLKALGNSVTLVSGAEGHCHHSRAALKGASEFFAKSEL